MSIQRRRVAAVVVAGLVGSLVVVLAPNAASAHPAHSRPATAHAVPKLKITGAAAAIWIADKVAGGVLSSLAGKGFNEVLLKLGILGDKTSEQLDAIQNKLDGIKVQLDQLQTTMNAVLQEVTETHYETLALPIKTLRNNVEAAEADFLEAMSLAGKTDSESRARVVLLTKQIADAVTGQGGLISQVNTVPEAISASLLTSTPFYHLVSNVTTTNRKFFTWRDSARIDAVYQYLLDLQALQFNLIIQVETLQGASPDTMYDRYVKPYLGDKTSFQAFLDKKTETPTVGTLHDELVAELKPLPPGVILQTAKNLEWSTDVPGGAQEKFLEPAGSGVPVCTTQAFPPGGVCVTDPKETIGPNQGPRSATSAAAQMASTMQRVGYGDQGEWQVPLESDLAGLQDGWNSSDGSLNSWLQRQMGTNPTTCNPVTAGGTEAISNWQACVWPKLADHWSSKYWGVQQQIQDTRRDTVRTYIYGWGFAFRNTNDGSQTNCFVFTKKLDWTDLQKTYPSTHPSGPTMELPKTAGCGGVLELVRVVRPGENYHF